MQALKSGRIPVLLLCAAIALAFYFAASAITPSFASEGDTADHEEEVTTLESLTERVVELENRIVELELQKEEAAAQQPAYPVFDAIVAVYLSDQIDIHSLHDRLKDGDGIMPGDSGQIKRLVTLLSAVDWPQELAEEGEALIETLTQFASALADDDLENAVPLASAAHDAQHHFSGSVSDWFKSTQSPEEEDPEQADQSSEEGNSDDSDDDDTESHGHDDDSDDDTESHGHDDDDDDDDSNDTHDDGHDHSHGE
ncbi:MAG: hypothetical protein OXC27_17815 [Caldilineaceae bacterium]|nr:hypothetical protein [Caldilineaceae bacterium]